MYHTLVDDDAHLQAGSIQHLGENVLATLREVQHSRMLDQPDTRDYTLFFDMLGIYLFPSGKQALTAFLRQSHGVSFVIYNEDCKYRLCFVDLIVFIVGPTISHLWPQKLAQSHRSVCDFTIWNHNCSRIPKVHPQYNSLNLFRSTPWWSQFSCSTSTTRCPILPTRQW